MIAPRIHARPRPRNAPAQAATLSRRDPAPCFHRFRVRERTAAATDCTFHECGLRTRAKNSHLNHAPWNRQHNQSTALPRNARQTRSPAFLPSQFGSNFPGRNELRRNFPSPAPCARISPRPCSTSAQTMATSAEFFPQPRTASAQSRKQVEPFARSLERQRRKVLASWRLLTRPRPPATKDFFNYTFSSPHKHVAAIE